MLTPQIILIKTRVIQIFWYNSVYATLTTVSANSISNVNSNVDIQFNSEQANYNHSLNISTFNPNPSLRDIID
jgi:hypothetical protein